MTLLMLAALSCPPQVLQAQASVQQFTVNVPQIVYVAQTFTVQTQAVQVREFAHAQSFSLSPCVQSQGACGGAQRGLSLKSKSIVKTRVKQR